MLDNAMWSGFTFLVGFLVIFRTSQAYARFWEGCSCIFRMRSEWFDACSSLIAFSRISSADAKDVARFQNILVRLFSMLHASALAEIEDSNSKVLDTIAAFRYELVDANGIDEESLFSVRQSDCKVELIYQWIQQHIVESIEQAERKTGILNIPPPILSRSFQEAANGMVAFNDAIKLSSVPFPWPYAQTCDCLLLIHFMLTPLVVAHWFTSPWWAGIFTFVTVFILWVLNSIAVEIENPFGSDENDIDCKRMQMEFNSQLVQLLSRRQMRTPQLSDNVSKLGVESLKGRQSMMEVWSAIDSLEVDVTRSIRSSSASHSDSMPRSITGRVSAWFSGATNARNGKSRSASTVGSERSSSRRSMPSVHFDTRDVDGSDRLASVELIISTSSCRNSNQNLESGAQEEPSPQALAGAPRITSLSAAVGPAFCCDVAGNMPETNEDVADALACEDTCAEAHAFPSKFRRVQGFAASASYRAGGPAASIPACKFGSSSDPPCQGTASHSRSESS